MPWQFDERPDLTYPTFLYHGHYHDDWATPAYFSETPPPPGLEGYEAVQAQYAYRSAPTHKLAALVLLALFSATLFAVLVSPRRRHNHGSVTPLNATRP